MIKKYVKKPIPIEACQWTGSNRSEINAFAPKMTSYVYTLGDLNPPQLTIHSLEGDERAKVGDYIVKGIRGEIYVCDKSIFEETYEEVTE